MLQICVIVGWNPRGYLVVSSQHFAAETVLLSTKNLGSMSLIELWFSLQQWSLRPSWQLWP